MVRKEWTKQEFLKAKTLVEEGKLITKISKILDRPVSSVYNKMFEHGIHSNAPHRVLARKGEVFAAHYLENHDFTIVKRGDNRTVYDYIVSKDNKTYALDVKVVNSAIRLLHFEEIKFERLRTYGIPVFLIVARSAIYWLEEIEVMKWQ